MTRQEANKIKKVLRAENAVITATAGYYNGNELRVKVSEFLVRSDWTKGDKTDEQKDTETRSNIIKVLRALTKNGMRPEYRTERRENTNSLGTWDCTYVIFK